jgi:signal transduction histidine kinase/ActR/RegA family two-component response regulator
MDSVGLAPSDAIDLEAVIITEQLSRRPWRGPDYEAENRALVALAQQIANSPKRIFQTLAETTLALCEAGSAGISLLEDDNGREIFRWHAIAGGYAPHLWGTTPRHFSPCGTVLDRKTVMLFDRPGRHFTYFAQLNPPIIEALLMPFAIEDEIVGTVWVMVNDDARKFDNEDARILGSLAKFASASYQVWSSFKSIQEANYRKDEFLAMLGHELRNPLAPILTALELMRLQDTEFAQKERSIIDRQVKHLLQLVEDLLDVSRITRGQVELEKQPVELAVVVARAIEMVSPLLDKQRHRLRVSLPTSGLVVEADSERLAQVIFNLLSNAAKYTGTGGEITIAGERETSSVIVRVKDTGIGIEPEMLPKVFDFFMQQGQGLDRAQGGLGLGLAIVRSLVELHGGEVTASSPGRGRGSEFTIRLPVAPTRIAVPVSPDVSAPGTPSGCRILIVDDNEDAADLLATSLDLLGYEVSVAHDGPSALRVTLTFKPHLALLDIGLPIMDGYELARCLRNDPTLAGIRLIAVTGYGLKEDRRQSHDAGFEAHLVKPVDLAKLNSIIRLTGPAAQDTGEFA